MKKFKDLLNAAPVKEDCHLLTDEELKKLQSVMLNAYKEIEAVCLKHNLSIAMTGGNAIGAIRHKGFIPWDDDVDLTMSREDFEKLKVIFEKELGDKYTLNSPNYSEKPTNRFPKILINGTTFLEYDMDDDERACIKMDIFILEKMPENKIVYKCKGIICNALMYIAGVVDTYEHRVAPECHQLASTKTGLRMYKRRLFVGRLFSFKSSYRWFDLVDKWCQYNKNSNLRGTPAGTNHYFATTMNYETYFPFREVNFEDTTVFIPNDYDTILRKSYGDYMKIPPVEKQEKHYIKKIVFPKEI